MMRLCGRGADTCPGDILKSEDNLESLLQCRSWESKSGHRAQRQAFSVSRAKSFIRWVYIFLEEDRKYNTWYFRYWYEKGQGWLGDGMGQKYGPSVTAWLVLAENNSLDQLLGMQFWVKVVLWQRGPCPKAQVWEWASQRLGEERACIS